MDRRAVYGRVWIAGLLSVALAGTGCGGSISTPDSYNATQGNTGSGGGSSGGGSTPPPSGGGTSSPPPPPPELGSGVTTIAWDSPSAEANQSCPQSLSGYRIYKGTAVGAYSSSETIPINALTCNATGQSGTCGAIETCSYRVQGLTRGTWYFAVTAYDATGNESVFSNTVAATIDY